MFFTPRYVKEARHFCEAARRVIRYRLDLLTAKQVAEVEDRIAALDAAANKRDRAAVDVDDLVRQLEPLHNRLRPLEIEEILVGHRLVHHVPLKAPSGDRRELIASLTSTGRALYRKIVPFALERETKLLSVLTAEEVEVLDRAMRKLSGEPG